MATTPVPVHRVELELVAGTHDKFYRAWCIEHLVVFEWGRRGTKGQVDVGVSATHPRAQEAMRRKLSSKRDRGYEPAEDERRTLNLDLSLRADQVFSGAAAAWRTGDEARDRQRLVELDQALAGPPDVVALLERVPNEERALPWASSALQRLDGLTRASTGIALVALPRGALVWLSRYWRGEVHDLGPREPDDAPPVFEAALALAGGDPSRVGDALESARLVIGA